MYCANWQSRRRKKKKKKKEEKGNGNYNGKALERSTEKIEQAGFLGIVLPVVGETLELVVVNKDFVYLRLWKGKDLVVGELGLIGRKRQYPAQGNSIEDIVVVVTPDVELKGEKNLEKARADLAAHKGDPVERIHPPID